MTFTEFLKDRYEMVIQDFFQMPEYQQIQIEREYEALEE